MVSGHCKVSICTVSRWRKAIIVRERELGFCLTRRRKTRGLYKISITTDRAIRGTGIFIGNSNVFCDQISCIFIELDVAIYKDIFGLNIFDATFNIDNISTQY